MYTLLIDTGNIKINFFSPLNFKFCIIFKIKSGFLAFQIIIFNLYFLEVMIFHR